MWLLARRELHGAVSGTAVMPASTVEGVCCVIVVVGHIHVDSPYETLRKNVLVRGGLRATQSGG